MIESAYAKKKLAPLREEESTLSKNLNDTKKALKQEIDTSEQYFTTL